MLQVLINFIYLLLKLQINQLSIMRIDTFRIFYKHRLMDYFVLT